MAHSRTTCKITWVTTGWEERLSAKQTGPIHLGFCTNPSSFKKDVRAIDPVTREPATITIMAEGPMSRIPLAAIFTALLSLPTVRCIRAIRRRRGRPHAPQRPLVSNRRELFFKAAVATSALLLIFTLFEWRNAQTTDLEITSIRSWKSQSFSPFDDNAPLCGIEFTPAGWQLTQSQEVSSESLQPYNSTSTLWITKASRDQMFLKPAPIPLSSILGFGVGHQEETNGNIRSLSRTAVIPHWAMATLFAILPATWVLQKRAMHQQNRRQKLGLCTNCGYDLRATPDKCPECGKQ